MLRKKIIATLWLMRQGKPYEASTLLLIDVLATIADAAGISSVLSFTKAAVDPAEMRDSEFYKPFFEGFNVKGDQEIVVFLGLVVFILLTISTILKILNAWLKIRFVTMRELELCSRLMQNYLDRPYTWFLKNHMSDVGHLVLNEVSTVIKGFLSPFLLIWANILQVFAILAILTYFEPVVTLILVGVFAVCYAFLFLIVIVRIRKWGDQRFRANRQRYKDLSETMNGFKEIKIFEKQKFFVDAFYENAANYATFNVRGALAQQLPRFVIEYLIFGFVILLAIYFVVVGGGLVAALPSLSVFLVSGYRLMPAVHSTYLNISKIRSNELAFSKICSEIIRAETRNARVKQRSEAVPSADIVLKNVSFRYSPDTKFVLREINLVAPNKKTTAIVGKSGVGKSTLLDILVGLNAPSVGDLMVGSVKINGENRQAWVRQIGYVPQHVYLLDRGIEDNIALKVSLTSDESRRLKEVCDLAGVSDFKNSRAGDLKVGERGKRLSGGQQKRLGIARALFRQPSVLVLDEPTAGLDRFARDQIIDTIKKLTGSITIILVTHQTELVEICDCVYELE